MFKCIIIVIIIIIIIILFTKAKFLGLKSQDSPNWEPVKIGGGCCRVDNSGKMNRQYFLRRTKQFEDTETN